ncbi:MAG: hypothetical protein JXA28_00155 [Bacteroidetes bacterium]|nr:hypothetical protein [Bacteroidota bacterium]
MLTLYLACLVFGGILLTISLFAGGDADTDMDHSLDVHGDVDMDHSLEMHADMDHSLDVHADVQTGTGDFDANAGEMHAGGSDLPVEVDADHPAVVSVQDADTATHGSALSAAFEFFSFRNLVYMTTFFGMTGSVLTWLAMPFTLTLGSSIGMGFFAGMVGHRFMKYLRGSESGESLHVTQLIGHKGTVTLPPTKTRKGKVRIVAVGNVIELIALLHEDSQEEELHFGDPIFILSIEKDVAVVDKADF